MARPIESSTTVRTRPSGLSGRWLIAGTIIVIAAILAALLINANTKGASAALVSTVAVTRGSLVATVMGSGNIAAEQSLSLAFQANGLVTAVVVKEGDSVQAGQVLARLDDRAAQLQVAGSQSSLDSARARLLQAQHGNARPEDLAAAQAAVASAQAAYDKLRNGPTGPDSAAAQAAVAGAQAAYNAAVAAAGTSGSQLEAARAAVQKAQANLQQAQASYDRVSSAPDIGRRPESLALQNATIDYQQARANYDALARTAGTDAASRIDSASAQLAQAKANLDKLTPGAEDTTAAKAGLDQAKANLARLTAPATATDLQIQQSAVDQAGQALAQAQLALDNTVLKAPFAGIVTQVSIVPGSLVSGGSPALRLIDRSPLHVDLKLTENDVAKVQLGQPVKITVQSLGGWQAGGTVSFVAPAAENVNGIVTYVVRVSFPDSDARVRVGMTADLSIEIARKDNVLLVPSTALLPKGATRVVQTPDAGVPAPSGQAGVREVEVQIGLSDGANTEILSGLSEGQQVVALPDSGVQKKSGPAGMFGGF